MSKSKRIVELFKQGYTASEIAKELNTRYQYVYTVLVVKGLKVTSQREKSNVPKILRDRGIIKRASSNRYWRERRSVTSGELFVRRGLSGNFPRCSYCKKPDDRCTYKDWCEYNVKGFCSKIKSV